MSQWGGPNSLETVFNILSRVTAFQQEGEWATQALGNGDWNRMGCGALQEGRVRNYLLGPKHVIRGGAGLGGLGMTGRTAYTAALAN